MRPVPPGEVLQEQLEELNMSASKLAAHLGVPTNRITGILNAQRALTADTALRLSKFFGTTPEFWMALQSNYELRKAEIEARPLAQVIPLRPRLRSEPARPLRVAPPALQSVKDARSAGWGESTVTGTSRGRHEIKHTGTSRAKKKAGKKAMKKAAKKAPARAKKA